MNSQFFQALFWVYVLAWGIVGCSRQETPTAAESPAIVERERTPVERAHEYMTNVLDLACRQNYKARDRVVEMMGWVEALPSSNRVEVFHEFCRVMREPKLPASSHLNRRNTAYEIHFTMVHTACSRFAEILDNGECAWRFLLEIFDFFPKEIERSKDSSFGICKEIMGMHWDKEIYVEALYENRFKMIRCMFEFDNDFSAYFNALSDVRRRMWQKDLERTACRPVIVYDPNIPNQPRVSSKEDPNIAAIQLKHRERHRRYLERKAKQGAREAKLKVQSSEVTNRMGIPAEMSLKDMR